MSFFPFVNSAAPVGFVKLNVDASFHADEGAGSVAGVLRDDRGNFIAGFCKFISLAADVVTIEAMAL